MNKDPIEYFSSLYSLGTKEDRTKLYKWDAAASKKHKAICTEEAKREAER